MPSRMARCSATAMTMSSVIPNDTPGPTVRDAEAIASPSAATSRSPLVTDAEGNAAWTTRTWIFPFLETSWRAGLPFPSASSSRLRSLSIVRSSSAFSRARSPSSSSETYRGFAANFARRLRADSTSRAASRSDSGANKNRCSAT